ncbi:hypothetical protein ABXJ56_09575 [Microbacterium chocolatum]|uniref:hypothetical protein n=1 Tax=Microbacterium aurantiacum TaxID=162393 RepID=UPI00338EE8D7
MLSPIPTVHDLVADEITHHFDDMIAPAGLTNFLGTVRVDHDLVAVSAVQFPPVSQGLAQTATLFVDGRVFASWGAEVSHTWRPDRVTRSATLPGLEIETITACVPGRPAVVVDIHVRNTGARARTLTLGLSLSARVTRAAGAWLDAESPSAETVATVEHDRIRFVAPDASAVSIQGLDAPASYARSGVASPADGLEVGLGGNGRGGSVSVDMTMDAGASARVGYVHVVGADVSVAEADFDAIVADVPGVVAAAEEFWNAQLEATFTPGNSEFSGHLPRLETSDESLRRIYWWAALGLIWFRRDFPGNVLGRSYDTLMPNYWGTTTFIWDYSLSSLSHALLDPTEMRRQLLHWITLDIHGHFGSSSLTGGPVGRWYSVNDYAMTRLVHDYLRVTGDDGFLDEETPEGTVRDSLVAWATAWRELRRGTALADYGEIDNLLECVSSYTHEVASLNAANVWCMRTVAEILERVGDPRADDLRRGADELLPHVLSLYRRGEGFFAARQPDGTELPVRHCYDFSIVGTTIAGDLDEQTRSEMVAFFQRELQTETWMRALSPWDPDASFSVRPDHQWNGAYPAWPADAGRALRELGAEDVLVGWLDGLACTANQGPMGQAHFVPEAVPPINGGARKAPPQLPYIIDWACSSSGAWTALIVEALFGVSVTVDGTVHAGGPVALIDRSATLRGLRVGDRLVDIAADGTVTDAVP